MKTGRADWDLLIRVAGIPSDEPTFILRAQDDDGADLVREWGAVKLSKGVSAAVVEQSLRQADAMDKWPVKKPVDAGHLSEAEAKQLAYAHSRRVWNYGRMSREALAGALIMELLQMIDIAPMSGALVELKAQAEALREALTGGRVDQEAA